MVNSDGMRLQRLAVQNEHLLDELRERQARLQELLQVSRDLSRAHEDEDFLFERVTHRGAEVLAADAVAVLIFHDRALTIRAATGDAGELFGSAATPATRQQLATALTAADAVTVSGLAEGRIGLAVPLRAEWQVIGVLALGRPTAQPFSVDDVLIATTFAAHAATAIQNARAHSEAREAERRKDDFLARLAHELRNPLAPIVNGLHLLGRAAAPGTDVARVQTILSRQVRRLGALVDDLLDVSRIRLGKLALNLEPVDLCAVARRSLEAVQLSSQAEGHDLGLSVPNEPVVVRGDPVRLEQIAGNLITNAVKYTPRGQPIRVAVERTATEAVLRVRDHGIGIAPEMLPNVFKLFAQMENAVSRAQGGLGLGLALVRALTEHHGGVVTAESAGLGRGSEFVVRLPLTSERVQPDAGDPGLRMARPARVLVVEDDADALEALRGVLEAAGHRVATADNGPAAVEVAAFMRPEVAFVDIGLPEMDGLEVARRVRRQPYGKRLHLVALTGYGQAEDRRRAREAGFDAHLVKPVAPETVLDLIAYLQSGAE
jgi:signal transduction histidine kinase/ActR/RegA family two-component response regulator